MYQELLNLIECPLCRSKLTLSTAKMSEEEIIEGTLTCNEGHRFSIRNGVVDFCSEEQSLINQWSKAYKEMDYETYDAHIEQMKSSREKELQQLVLNQFIREICPLKDKVVVDIASGRGMLLTALAACADTSLRLIATDLSFEVLMYDRLKLKKMNPKLRANFIACDAANLPLKSHCADRTVSFFGIANMLDSTEHGIREAARILKTDGALFNAFLHIQEASQGFEAVRKFYAEHQSPGAETVYLPEIATRMHKKHFANVQCEIICEDIKDSEESALDLLPYPGEWFAYVIYRCCI